LSTLEITNLSFAYEGATGWSLQNLSLNIERGEIVCILGASGCGKTTLLNLIAGLLKPAAGAISASKRIGYIFQTDALFPWRTVEANLNLARDLGYAQSDVAEYLKAFHLSTDVLSKYPSQLSGGMRQRVSIIQSLMFNPELLLLDEPFSALDFYTKLRLETEFHNLVKQQEKAAILVTHDIEEAIALGDRVIVMNKSGEFSKQFEIRKNTGNSDFEAARGTPEFAEYYRTIWSELKGVVGDA